MKTSLYLQFASVFTLGLSACKPAANTAADEEVRRQMEVTRAAYEQQAADMQSRSETLQKQLADLERSIKDKENADLRAKVDAISTENQKLMADAASARRKSEELKEQLASNRYTPPAVSQPYQPPYVPPQISPSVPSRPWVDPSADYSMFYDSLNPHGRWLNVDGYGYAFSPRIGSRSSWRPYVDGRWVSTSQGWAWDSNEPFGWACYHYGRWTRIARHGWVWIPGRQWAPSWVSWRYGSDSVGWAPLPPSVGYGSIGHDCDARYGIAPTSYTFIRATNFSRSSYVNVSLSITNITQIFHQTINVTNIVQVRQQQNNLFIQRGGPALDWVEKRCGERIERAPIQVIHTLERPGEHRPGHSDHGFIAAPLPSGHANRPTELPRNAERVIAPTVVDAWTEVPADQRDDLRKAITEQATEAQPKPVLAVTDPIIVEPVREAPTQPAIPAPTVTEVPGRGPGRDRDKGDAPAMRQPEIAQDAANKADLARRDAERQMQEAQAEREKQLAEQKAAESALVAQQENLAKKQAEAIAMQEQIAEQAKKDADIREKQVSEMSDKQTAALKEKQASEMAAQQEELVKKQAEALAMQQQIAEQEKKAQAMREEQAAIMKQQEAEAEKAKELARMTTQQEAEAKEAAMQAEALKQQQMQAAQQEAEQRKLAEMEAAKARENAMAAQQAAQEELARRQTEAAMQAQQEVAERQRQAAMEAQREAAMQAQQEAAERQRQAAMEAQREAAMQAQQEAAERQRLAAMEAQREAAMQAQQEAAERQRQAAMEAQREAAMRAQQEAQEAMRQQQVEAARRAQEEALRAQQEAAQRAAAEEAARRAAQQPPPGQ